MPSKNKKTKSAGRYGVRYGKKVRVKLVSVETKQRQKQKCPFCNYPTAKRKSAGIWVCKKCKKTFSGGAYYLD